MFPFCFNGAHGRAVICHCLCTCTCINYLSIWRFVSYLTRFLILVSRELIGLEVVDSSDRDRGGKIHVMQTGRSRDIETRVSRT